MELARGECVQDEEVEGALLEFRRGHLDTLSVYNKLPALL
jgi:hypothetical protein